MAEFVSSDESHMMGRYEYTVINLSPGITYSFSVAAVREGEGGEGPSGPNSQPVTLPGQFFHIPSNPAYINLFSVMSSFSRHPNPKFITEY